MILEAKNLEFSYHRGTKKVFHGVNLGVKQGEILTILGPNGAGKSTLLNCLANVLDPTSGEIILDGKTLSRMSPREIAQIMGYVPQNHESAYAYSVRDFVVMGRAPYLGMFQKPSDKDYALAESVMDEMGITKYADKPYTEISGGERQQACIARAIVQQPKIIMLDEPTNHLDYGNQIRAIKMIKTLSEKGYAIIMTTHMPDHAILLGGKVGILDYDGIFRVGHANDILQEDTLRRIYRCDLHIMDVKEIGRKVCVAGNLQ